MASKWGGSHKQSCHQEIEGLFPAFLFRVYTVPTCRTLSWATVDATTKKASSCVYVRSFSSQVALKSVTLTSRLLTRLWKKNGNVGFSWPEKAFYMIHVPVSRRFNGELVVPIWLNVWLFKRSGSSSCHSQYLSQRWGFYSQSSLRLVLPVFLWHSKNHNEKKESQHLEKRFFFKNGTNVNESEHVYCIKGHK